MNPLHNGIEIENEINNVINKNSCDVMSLITHGSITLHKSRTHAGKLTMGDYTDTINTDVILVTSTKLGELHWSNSSTLTPLIKQIINNYSKSCSHIVDMKLLKETVRNINKEYINYYISQLKKVEYTIYSYIFNKVQR